VLSSNHTRRVTGQGYPSDLSDSQWNRLAGLLERPKGPGRPPIHAKRVIVNAIRYLVRTGCAWRYLPRRFPPWKTVYWHLCRMQDTGLLQHIHHQLHTMCRHKVDRAAQPSAAIIDSASMRAADTVHRPNRGWDNGKKVNGRKRHIIVDTQGLILAVSITPANQHDTTAARDLLATVAARYPRINLIWADAAYQGKRTTDHAANLGIDIHIVKKRQGQTTFEVLPRRWTVERTLAWLTKHRRLVKDYETNPTRQLAIIQWASTTWMLQRLNPHHQ
jgi:transposase